MKEHPINELMEKAMENIKKMVEVNTIIGEAVETPNGTVIIPVTKVSCGFAAGGTQGDPLNNSNTPAVLNEPPEANNQTFGGGSGGGVMVQPVGFLVIHDDDVRFQVVDHTAIFDRLLDQVPEFIKQIKCKKGSDTAAEPSAAEFIAPQVAVTIESGQK